MHNQLLSGPVRAYKVSFPTKKVDPGKLIKSVVTRYRSYTEYATVHTRERWAQAKLQNIKIFAMRFGYVLLIVFQLSFKCTPKQEYETIKDNSRSVELDYGFKITFLDNEVFDSFIVLWNTRIYHNEILVYSDSISEFEVIDNSIYPSIRKIMGNRFEILLIANDRPGIEKMKRIVFHNDQIEKIELIPFFTKPIDIDNDGKLEVGGILSYYELSGVKPDTMPYVPILVYKYNDAGIELDSLKTVNINIKIYSEFHGYEYSEKYSFKKRDIFQDELKKFR